MSKLELSNDDMFIVFMMLREKNRGSSTTWFCGHNSRKHYAKGLCSSCYHSPKQIIIQWLKFNCSHSKRTPRALECGHNERIHRARGLCGLCYTKWKRNRRIEREQEKENNILGE